MQNLWYLYEVYGVDKYQPSDLPINFVHSRDQAHMLPCLWLVYNAWTMRACGGVLLKCFNPCHAEFTIGENSKYRCILYHLSLLRWNYVSPDSKVRGANMGPTWVLLAPGGPHVTLLPGRCSWKARTCLPQIFNTIAAEDLPIKDSRISAIMASIVPE